MKINKVDLIIILSIILISVLLFFSFGGSVFSSSGRILKIYSEGRLYAEYNLDTLREAAALSVQNSLGCCKLSISKDKVVVTESDCRDKLCLNKSADKNGHSIVCLPNKILISIVSDETEQIDSVAY